MHLMLVELVGSGGVGKTTVEPFIASRLGIEYHPGKSTRGEHREPATPIRAAAEKASTIAHNPGLALRAFRTLDRPVRRRIRFALDTNRRDRFAMTAARAGTGVIASGPVHGLCVASARYRYDTIDMVDYVRISDIYVFLIADVDEVSRRLLHRRELRGESTFTKENAVAHWHNYNNAARSAFERIDRPVLEIDASPSPDLVADAVAEGLMPLLAAEKHT